MKWSECWHVEHAVSMWVQWAEGVNPWECLRHVNADGTGDENHEIYSVKGLRWQVQPFE